MTVGIIGAGRIGTTIAAHLSGFGCRVLYWNRTPKDSISAEYRPLPGLLRECDIISLHLSSNEDTYHFMDADKIAQMKSGSVLINTSRGALVDSDALIDALESGHLAGAGLDVVDGDRNIYYSDHQEPNAASPSDGNSQLHAQCADAAPYGLLHRSGAGGHGAKLPCRYQRVFFNPPITQYQKAPLCTNAERSLSILF